MSRVTKIIQRVLEKYENKKKNSGKLDPGHDYVYNNRINAKIEVLKELIEEINN